jgi:dTDP-4-amino-4,6-dideoxy-D-galactose acyltransferase
VTDPCELLEWDSAFFGLRIGRVLPRRLTEELAEDIFRWREAHRIDCLYFLADLADPATLALAPRHGFDLIDVRTTLETNGLELPTATDAAFRIRTADGDDLPALRGIARVSHRDSRFYSDMRFARDRCDELFSTWIEKSCSGWADVVLVADTGQGASAYITGHLASPARGRIGLVGVAPEWRQRGCGRALVGSLLEWFAARAISQVTVVTQGRNLRALWFYERCGFHVAGLDLWYHCWPRQSGASG